MTDKSNENAPRTDGITYGVPHVTEIESGTYLVLGVAKEDGDEEDNNPGTTVVVKLN